LLTDRRLSVDFFVDERRMERDLLADGAEARLLELFGHWGRRDDGCPIIGLTERKYVNMSQ